MPQPLSETFDSKQYQMDDPIPDECLPVLQELHTQIILPVMARFGTTIVTSGYRSPEANTEAHGQKNSEHVFSDTHCAADFYSPNVGARTIFDWMRMNSSLPFHQLILEHSANGSSIVHVSLNKLMPGVRSVLEGSTHNSSPYIKIDHAAYIAPAPSPENSTFV